VFVDEVPSNWSGWLSQQAIFVTLMRSIGNDSDFNLSNMLVRKPKERWLKSRELKGR
jgi:hypothetical protein